MATPELAVENGPVILTLRKIEKGGLISYARKGVRASLYFNKTMFREGKPPQRISLTADGLAIAVEQPKPKAQPKSGRARKAATTTTTKKKKATRKRATKKKATPDFINDINEALTN